MTFDILDCTLRDGGYYTDWDFSPDLVDRYLNAMASLPVQLIEVGYRSPPKQSYLGAYFHLRRTTLERCRRRLRADQKMAVMLNFKDVVPGELGTMLKGLADVVSIIRFACPPSELAACIEFARTVKSFGFEVAINVMYLTQYANSPEILAPLADAGDVVDYVSLVDSYGGCLPSEVSYAVQEATKLLPQRIGFHGHDNVSLVFANSMAALDAGATVLDATMLGMGRGAGNLKTELISLYKGKVEGLHVDHAALSASLEDFESLQKKFGWGTNLAYMISGLSHLPQADVMDWLGTRRYSLDSIVSALKNQAGEKVDDKVLVPFEDSEIAARNQDARVILIGGGSSSEYHLEALRSLASQRDTVLVHSTLRMAHLFSDVSVPQIFCLAGQEFRRAKHFHVSMIEGPNKALVAPSAPRFAGSLPENATVFGVSPSNRSSVVSIGPVSDEPPLDLALSVAIALNAQEVLLAGFDGYPEASVADQHNAKIVQRAIEDAISGKYSWGSNVAAITPTIYDIPRRSVHSYVQGF